MGILLIVLGLAGAGVVADYLVENHLATAPNEPLTLFGATFNFSTPEIVLAGAVLGAAAVILVILGLGLLRGSWGRRRALKRKISDLEQENTNLLTRQRLEEAARTDQQGTAQQEAAHAEGSGQAPG
jgi:hypothetical protein